MIILFLDSLCPILIVSLWQIFTSVDNIEKLGLEGYLNVISFARIIMYLNSSTNPLIYSLTSTKFKLAYKRVLQRRSSPRTSAKRDYQQLHLATQSTQTQPGSRKKIIELFNI